MIYSRHNSSNLNARVVAHIQGGPLAPDINGIAWFRDVCGMGTQVCIEVTGLPPYRPASNGNAPIGPLGFHIHECGNCDIGDPQGILFNKRAVTGILLISPMVIMQGIFLFYFPIMDMPICAFIPISLGLGM